MHFGRFAPPPWRERRRPGALFLKLSAFDHLLVVHFGHTSPSIWRIGVGRFGHIARSSRTSRMRWSAWAHTSWSGNALLSAIRSRRTRCCTTAPTFSRRVRMVQTCAVASSVPTNATARSSLTSAYANAENHRRS